MTIINYSPEDSEILSLDKFREMDYMAVEHGLTIPIMMEQAGYHFARVVSHSASKSATVNIGIGPGNNGGGGLVAARRLHAWGFDVALDLIDEEKQSRKDLISYLRTVGVKFEPNWVADFQVDAYLGFSQRIPLGDEFERSLNRMNQSSGIKISLDMPTGLSSDWEFKSDVIVCLAAAKDVLKESSATVYIADLGIPQFIYKAFGFRKSPPFNVSSLLKWK